VARGSPGPVPAAPVAAPVAAMGDHGPLSRPPLPLRFVKSVDDARQLPDSGGEVAVVGRSNVGKSSLVNALAGRDGLARVSKTPGRTRLLNCFEVDGGGTLVDCPGYGYAEASKAARASWRRMIEDYLLGREQLSMLIVLVDGEIGPTRLDLQLLDWLRANTLPHTVIATKADKVRSSHRPRRRQELAAACRLDPDDVVWVSAAKGTGIDRLRELVHLWLSGT
jgi:GTP-binding protein